MASVKSLKSVVGWGSERAMFLGACQQYILDKQAPDTHFGQCLQGFRVVKKPPTMGCTISAFCAKIVK
jgi:hypothetical protein